MNREDYKKLIGALQKNLSLDLNKGGFVLESAEPYTVKGVFFFCWLQS